MSSETIHCPMSSETIYSDNTEPTTNTVDSNTDSSTDSGSSTKRYPVFDLDAVIPIFCQAGPLTRGQAKRKREVQPGEDASELLLARYLAMQANRVERFRGSCQYPDDAESE